MTNELSIETTPIPGLLKVNLPLQGDNRGWFKEHWQREKMVALGLPDFAPVQQNISFNSKVGTTRGIHAEPWDKYVSVAAGRVFGAWVDLREGESFGSTFTLELSPEVAVFVPRGIANSFQTLEPDTSYMYLVNDHWSPTAEYSFVNLADPELGINWPISLKEAVVSEKDLGHPILRHAKPVKPKITVVIGGDGQLGRALKSVLPSDTTLFTTKADIDLTKPETIEGFDWSAVGTIINAAAFTAVDDAESEEGRQQCWAINATAVAHLSRIASIHAITFVTVSTDYVFDGVQGNHDESEPYTPLGVYGQSKVAGELAAIGTQKHYIVRTSWVIGDGKNFVKTMLSLAQRGIAPSVIDDQYGRLTFADDLARALVHLVESNAPFGIYNFSNSGEVMSWFEISQEIFRLAGFDAHVITPVSTSQYFESQAAQGRHLAPRPAHSDFDLEKVSSAGASLPSQQVRLAHYIDSMLKTS